LLSSVIHGRDSGWELLWSLGVSKLLLRAQGDSAASGELQDRWRCPMELEQLLAAAFAGGSGMAAVWCIVRLLVKASRDPKRLGAWLPRVRAGWHIGMTELEKARQQHEETKQKRTEQKPIRAARR
jgi:hypothetical protein